MTSLSQRRKVSQRKDVSTYLSYLHVSLTSSASSASSTPSGPSGSLIPHETTDCTDCTDCTDFTDCADCTDCTDFCDGKIFLYDIGNLQYCRSLAEAYLVTNAYLLRLDAHRSCVRDWSGILSQRSAERYSGKPDGVAGTPRWRIKDKSLITKVF